jgi:hypothetical protein
LKIMEKLVEKYCRRIGPLIRVVLFPYMRVDVLRCGILSEQPLKFPRKESPRVLAC